MAEYSLGVVVPGGNGPVRFTANQDDPTAQVWAHSFRVVRWQGTGRGYILRPDGDILSGDGVIGFIPASADEQHTTPYQSPAAEGRQHPYELSSYYMDADEVGDGFLISYQQV